MFILVTAPGCVCTGTRHFTMICTECFLFGNFVFMCLDYEFFYLLTSSGWNNFKERVAFFLRILVAGTVPLFHLTNTHMI